MTCERCPCKEVCLRLPAYCRWAAKDPPVLHEIRHICDASAMRGGKRYEPPEPRASIPRPAGLSREIVVARWREDIRWLDLTPPDFFVSVYDKGGDPTLLRREHRVVPTRNAGREAFSYLHHICTHYDSLADWTYFVQGDADFHAPDIIGRLGVEYDDTCSLTETYSPSHPPEWIHERDMVEHHGGFRVRYGDASIPDHDLRTNRAWLNPAVWPHVFEGEQPVPLWFAYAAMLAVPRRRIVDRPFGLWLWLRDEVARAPTREEWTEPPLNAWAMEAIWKYLWSSPDEYPHRKDRVLPPVAESVGLLERAKKCPYRSRGPGCGCSGANCSLKDGKVVSLQECFSCLKTYG